jgi:hypothetical protein
MSLNSSISRNASGEMPGEGRGCCLSQHVLPGANLDKARGDGRYSYQTLLAASTIQLGLAHDL